MLLALNIGNSNITFGAYEVLYEERDPHEVLVRLMTRQRKDELEPEESWI